jgi:hypothetical protein
MKTTLFGALVAAAALASSLGSVAPVSAVALPGSTSAVASTGCPVTARVLLKNLRKSAAYQDGDVAATKKLTKVHCYQGYATALTHPKELDPLTVVFRYGAVKKNWKLINFGSSQVCDGVVPDKVKSHLTGC